MQASMYGPVSEFVSQNDYNLILVSEEWTYYKKKKNYGRLPCDSAYYQSQYHATDRAT
jgi:hypothetical protein